MKHERNIIRVINLHRIESNGWAHHVIVIALKLIFEGILSSVYTALPTLRYVDQGRGL